ncbi:hypothetical protein RRG08_002156 [Elysia crispata]|uniref:Uncharacterized protein n=1 Tax=Elysia crispata TaxID=231223 RepID=A0AAE0ZB26_9GAST|nr:hypothetical protein RRG08_002156 [Elysia crispata]
MMGMRGRETETETGKSREEGEMRNTKGRRMWIKENRRGMKKRVLGCSADPGHGGGGEEGVTEESRRGRDSGPRATHSDFENTSLRPGLKCRDTSTVVPGVEKVTTIFPPTQLNQHVSHIPETASHAYLQEVS